MKFVWVIALFAGSMFGVGYAQAISPGGTVVAECFDGQTLDSSTGVCPADTGAADPTDTSNSWGSAVKEAEAANQADESLAGSH